MVPPRHIRFKHTRQLKEAAQRQLTKFRDEILARDKQDPCFWNPRVKNLLEDIDDLQRDVDALDEATFWPVEFSDRFRDIYGTTRRIGLFLSNIDEILI